MSYKILHTILGAQTNPLWTTVCISQHLQDPENGLACAVLTASYLHIVKALCSIQIRTSFSAAQK